MRRNRKSDDSASDASEDLSDEDSVYSPDSSDSGDYNPKTNNKKPATPKKKRGRPPAKRNTKKTRVQNNDSGSDSNPVPSTSAYVPSSPNESESEESESEDSDYGPAVDKSLRKRKNVSQGRPSKLTKKPGGAKKKKTSQSVNGVSSQNRPETNNQASQSKVSSQKRPETNNQASQSKVNTPKRPVTHNQASRRKSANEVSYGPKEIENLAQKLVYFLLIDDQKKYAIKRKAIITHVFKDEAYSPKLYSNVLLKANGILKKTYGMELLELENSKDSYLIVNILNRDLGIHEFVELSKLKQQQYGLMLYLLTVIFMNGNVITEDELTKSLKPLGIDLTSKKLHPVFGDVKKYITSELVKQMYLNYECISREPPNYELTWGIRAKQELDKRDLLQFNCQIMFDTTPESWRMQYNDAEKSANPRANGTI